MLKGQPAHNMETLLCARTSKGRGKVVPHYVWKGCCSSERIGSSLQCIVLASKATTAATKKTIYDCSHILVKRGARPKSNMCERTRSQRRPYCCSLPSLPLARSRRKHKSTYQLKFFSQTVARDHNITQALPFGVE